MNTQILQGDCRKVLKTLPDESVNCCVTSPPYFGLRDYGIDGQIGLEMTPDAYVGELIFVFRDIKRILREEGTLWLNLGDSYSSGGRTTTTVQTVRGDCSEEAKRATNTRPPVIEGIKPKDLIGIPWMVAFALRQDGWYLRQDIIWHKPNPMPESVTDRCTKAHEYIFLLSKSERYYYDNKAIGEPLSTEPHKAGNNHASERTTGPNDRGGKSQWDDTHERTWCKSGFRNKRSVWKVNPKPCKEAHFATFPEELITPMILAGCPANGTVIDPFGGSGTTGKVCETLGRNSILIELNPKYIEIQKNRTAQTGFAL